MSATNGILVIAEPTPDGVSRNSMEVIAYAQGLGGPLWVVVPGPSGLVQADVLSALDVDRVVLSDYLYPGQEQPAGFDADAYVAIIARAVETMAPRHVLMPHSYGARDYAPRLAARLGLALVSDCIGIEREGDDFAYLRQMFLGRAQSRVLIQGEGSRLVTLQAGIARLEDVRGGDATTRLTRNTIELAHALRVRAQPAFRESERSIDLSRARSIVAVGRGIKTQENIALARRLADLLGAELAASRAVCDEGWLPIDRQVGSSGQTVTPGLYIALGISGAIQHLVGMKNADTIVAINKDASAPIFKVADYGIVGDLFAVVPALISALEAG